MDRTTCYRLQTKLREGNVFTPVCDSVHRRVSVQGGICPGVRVSVQRWGSLSRGGGLCPGGGSLSRGGVSVQGWGLCPGGLFLGGSLSGGLCLGGLCHRTPPYCGRAGGTNPTGMHSCLQLVLKMFIALDNEEIVYLVFK